MNISVLLVRAEVMILSSTTI